MDSTTLNPFVVGGAIGDRGGQGFFGRDKIFDFVRSALNSVRRPPILLLGQRRIGKSSVLRQLPSRLPPEYCCVYFDLQGKGQMNLDGVLFGLGRAISDGLKIPRPERDQATEAGFDAFLERAFEKLDGHRERLVLLFDEFDVVDEHSEVTKDAAVNRFVPYLAELIARYPQVGYILVVGRKTEELSGSLNGILLKDAIKHPIGRLGEDEVRDLILKSSGGMVAFDEPALQRVFRLAAGHPFCTQVLCHVIWDRMLKGSATPPVPVHAPDIDACLPEALELGANGMNWIFDGLTDPVHRLVLAAIAQESKPAEGSAVDRSAIDAALRRRSAVLESVEIDRAVRELESWDVLEQVDTGFRFAVPMIGLWIQERRPLERLEREARFANPRAWKFYELALDSRARGDLDETIEELREALHANPSFAEAQRALGSALFQRGRPEELSETIENLERAFDLDPTGPRTELLEALAIGVTSTGNVETVKSRFKRIRELDPGGPYETKAIRAVNERGRVLAEGSSNNADVAASLFDLTGAEAEAAAARQRVHRARASGWTAALWFFSTVGVFTVGYLPLGGAIPWVRLFLAIGGGLVLAYSLHVDRPKGLTNIALLVMAVAIAGSLIWMYLSPGNAPAYTAVGIFFVLLSNMAPNADTTTYPEDQARSSSDTLASRVVKAASVLVRGSLPDSRRRKENK